MAGRPRPTSFPSAPSEPSLRRLGVGRGSEADRPLRAQLVVALVVGLILLAVPLYLWRRPSGKVEPPTGSTLAAQSPLPAALDRSAGSPGAAPDAGKVEERVRIAALQRVKCSASQAVQGQSGSLCDSLPKVEEAFVKAIRDTVDCAPKMGKEGTINYVLNVDFNHRSVHVFPGASGTWKGPQARRAANCIKRSLPAPAWDSTLHQYRHYVIAALATYPAPGATAPTASGAPLFE